jgi:steroid delta-isomerase-like uncharacterized protein
MVDCRDAPPTPQAHHLDMTTTTPPDTALRHAREAVVQAHMEAECNHDVAATLRTFSEANYDVVPLGAATHGATAVEELLQGLFEAFPDFRASTRSIHHGDDIVFVDTVITGTHEGTWAGVPASGNRMEVRCGCIFHFDDDRLTKETVYFDHATLLAQIGVQG